MNLLISVLIAVIILTAGCETTKNAADGPVSASPIVSEGPSARFTSQAVDTTSTAELYRVGPRDQIQIFVARHPEFEGKLLIDPRGRITLPTSETEISVSGLDIVQIARKIAMEIRPFVVQTPRVRVQIVETNAKTYYVVGGVNRPGRYRLTQVPVTVKDAILAAGLPDGGGKIEKVVLIKADPVKPTSVVLNAAAILRGDLGHNVVLRDGDIIFVPTETYSQVNRMQVDLELHLERGASTETLHDFVKEKLLGASAE